MEKLIDSKDYYVESRKAIDIALAKDEFKKLTSKERLKVYYRHLEETKDQEEYKALKVLKDDIEMKIKFHDTYEPVVPKADQGKIIKNLKLSSVP